MILSHQALLVKYQWLISLYAPAFTKAEIVNDPEITGENINWCFTKNYFYVFWSTIVYISKTRVHKWPFNIDSLSNHLTWTYKWVWDFLLLFCSKRESEWGRNEDDNQLQTYRRRIKFGVWIVFFFFIGKKFCLLPASV